MIAIRPQNRTTDPALIKAVNGAAFAEHGETAAFDEFRTTRTDILSLVAEDNAQLIGHVLFSPVTLATPNGDINGMGLGQLAVDPRYQKQGIGSELSITGLQQLRTQGCPFVIVIGHSTYYPRFGFSPGTRQGIQCQWGNVPDETFMVLILDETCRDKLIGVASFDGL